MTSTASVFNLAFLPSCYCGASSANYNDSISILKSRGKRRITITSNKNLAMSPNIFCDVMKLVPIFFRYTSCQKDSYAIQIMRQEFQYVDQLLRSNQSEICWR